MPALTAVGVLLLVVGWKASVPVLSWIVIFVGGFVTLVAVFLLAAISLQALRVRYPGTVARTRCTALFM